MGINKVEVFGKKLIDRTADTVTPATLLKGVTAHDAAGNAITGAYDGGASGGTMFWRKILPVLEKNVFAIPCPFEPKEFDITYFPYAVIEDKEAEDNDDTASGDGDTTGYEPGTIMSCTLRHIAADSDDRFLFDEFSDSGLPTRMLNYALFIDGEQVERKNYGDDDCKRAYYDPQAQVLYVYGPWVTMFRDDSDAEETPQAEEEDDFDPTNFFREYSVWEFLALFDENSEMTDEDKKFIKMLVALSCYIVTLRG